MLKWNKEVMLNPNDKPGTTIKQTTIGKTRLGNIDGSVFNEGLIYLILRIYQILQLNKQLLA